MAIQRIDPKLIYKQLEHLEKEIQVIKAELVQLAPTPERAKGTSPETETAWEALQEAKGLWEREWDDEWERIWEKR